MSSVLVSRLPSPRTHRGRTQAKRRASAQRRLRVLASVPRVVVVPPRKGGLPLWYGAAAALVAHAAVVLLAFVGESTPSVEKEPEQRLVMVSVPPKPIPVPEVESAALQPAPKRRQRPRKVTPPEPVAPTPEAAPPPSAEPPPRVVGLSFESTVSGGSGPSFATGNSQLGRTADVAAEPTSVKPRRAGDGFNRRARINPGAGGDLVLPKRVQEIEPDYPPDLRALGVEANVVVRVLVSAAGLVTRARIIRGADNDAFDRSARAAALREKFQPATLGGVATEYELSFTYRFRLDS